MPLAPNRSHIPQPVQRASIAASNPVGASVNPLFRGNRKPAGPPGDGQFYKWRNDTWEKVEPGDAIANKIIKSSVSARMLDLPEDDCKFLREHLSRDLMESAEKERRARLENRTVVPDDTFNLPTFDQKDQRSFMRLMALAWYYVGGLGTVGSPRPPTPQHFILSAESSSPTHRKRQPPISGSARRPSQGSASPASCEYPHPLPLQYREDGRFPMLQQKMAQFRSTSVERDLPENETPGAMDPAVEAEDVFVSEIDIENNEDPQGDLIYGIPEPSSVGVQEVDIFGPRMDTVSDRCLSADSDDGHLDSLSDDESPQLSVHESVEFMSFDDEILRSSSGVVSEVESLPLADIEQSLSIDSNLSFESPCVLKSVSVSHGTADEVLKALWTLKSRSGDFCDDGDLSHQRLGASNDDDIELTVRLSEDEPVDMPSEDFEPELSVGESVEFLSSDHELKHSSSGVVSEVESLPLILEEESMSNDILWQDSKDLLMTTSASFTFPQAPGASQESMIYGNGSPCVLRSVSLANASPSDVLKALLTMKSDGDMTAALSDDELLISLDEDEGEREMTEEHQGDVQMTPEADHISYGGCEGSKSYNLYKLDGRKSQAILLSRTLSEDVSLSRRTPQADLNSAHCPSDDGAEDSPSDDFSYSRHVDVTASLRQSDEGRNASSDSEPYFQDELHPHETMVIEPAIPTLIPVTTCMKDSSPGPADDARTGGSMVDENLDSSKHTPKRRNTEELITRPTGKAKSANVRRVKTTLLDFRELKYRMKTSPALTTRSSTMSLEYGDNDVDTGNEATMILSDGSSTNQNTGCSCDSPDSMRMPTYRSPSYESIKRTADSLQCTCRQQTEQTD